jgi:hypothetical protein
MYQTGFTTVANYEVSILSSDPISDVNPVWLLKKMFPVCS